MGDPVRRERRPSRGPACQPLRDALDDGSEAGPSPRADGRGRAWVLLRWASPAPWRPRGWSLVDAGAGVRRTEVVADPLVGAACGIIVLQVDAVACGRVAYDHGVRDGWLDRNSHLGPSLHRVPLHHGARAMVKQDASRTAAQ